MMRTRDAASNHDVLQMSITLALFVIIYFSVFTVGITYMMRLVGKGPTAFEQERVSDDPLSLAK
jgi:cytochrome d ubiquinol oxidase subunit I